MAKALQLLAILLTAIAMAAGWAHLLELPRKMVLSADAYLMVQQLYRGWSLLGIVVVAALVCAGALAVLQRGQGSPFHFALAATICIGLSLVVFFALTFPANQATRNWTFLPQNWEALRRQWEYSHAAGALLYFVALAALALSVIVNRR